VDLVEQLQESLRHSQSQLSMCFAVAAAKSDTYPKWEDYRELAQ